MKSLSEKLDFLLEKKIEVSWKCDLMVSERLLWKHRDVTAGCGGFMFACKMITKLLKSKIFFLSARLQFPVCVRCEKNTLDTNADALQILKITEMCQF